MVELPQGATVALVVPRRYGSRSSAVASIRAEGDGDGDSRPLGSAVSPRLGWLGEMVGLSDRASAGGGLPLMGGSPSDLGKRIRDALVWDGDLPDLSACWRDPQLAPR